MRTYEYVWIEVIKFFILFLQFLHTPGLPAHLIPSNPTGHLDTLKSRIRCCLETASEAGMTSISFPALGSGRKGFPCAGVAEAIFEEVHAFSEKFPNTPLNSIHVTVVDWEKYVVS